MSAAASVLGLQLGAGAGLGFITGYAVKKIFEAIIIVIGFFFMALFGLASTGAVTIQWDKVFGVADMGANRMAEYLAGTGAVVLQHIPITGGFSLGFIYAMRK